MAFRIYVESPSAQIHINEIQDDLRMWLAEEVAEDTRRFAPIDTGYMSTHVEVRDGGRRVEVLGAGIPPNENAPVYVEYGTRPHLIPNAFGYGITVMHPGTEAQPFMRPAAYRKRAIPPWAIKSRANLDDR